MMGAVAVIGNNEAVSPRKRKNPAVSQLHGGVAGQQLEHMATVPPAIRKIAGAFENPEAPTCRLERAGQASRRPRPSEKYV